MTRILMASLIAVAVAASTQAGSTNETVWQADYGKALEATRGDDRPLLVVLEDPKAEKTDDNTEQADAELLHSYQLCRIDASTEYGKRVAKVFKATTFPFRAIIDKTGSIILVQEGRRAERKRVGDHAGSGTRRATARGCWPAPRSSAAATPRSPAPPTARPASSRPCGPPRRLKRPERPKSPRSRPVRKSGPAESTNRCGHVARTGFSCFRAGCLGTLSLAGAGAWRRRASGRPSPAHRRPARAAARRGAGRGASAWRCSSW